MKGVDERNIFLLTLRFHLENTKCAVLFQGEQLFRFYISIPFYFEFSTEKYFKNFFDFIKLNAFEHKNEVKLWYVIRNLEVLFS